MSLGHMMIISCDIYNVILFGSHFKKNSKVDLLTPQKESAFEILH